MSLFLKPQIYILCLCKNETNTNTNVLIGELWGVGNRTFELLIETGYSRKESKKTLNYFFKNYNQGAHERDTDPSRIPVERKVDYVSTALLQAVKAHTTILMRSRNAACSVKQFTG